MLGTHEYCASTFSDPVQSILTRNLTYLVSVVPNSDTNASIDAHACLDHCLVVLLLLRQERIRRRKRHADIELSDCDLQSQSGELLHDGRQPGRNRADDEVALEADTVNWHTVGDELLHEVEHRGDVRARVLDVVVVDVQLRGRVGGARSLEGDRDVARAERVVEDVGTPGSVNVERLCVREC